MHQTIRIGSRDSRLALYQAEEVRKKLVEAGQVTSIVPIKSDGDMDVVTPLYESGIQGIFTRTLDSALLEKKIDIAVHSYKDVPTALASGLQIAAVLKRGNPFDVLVCRNEKMRQQLETDLPLTIATSSIRRKAQWLYKYKKTQVENIRGNVDTRLKKLQGSQWHGVILAKAGLDRLEITENISGPQITLDWMLPAPAQGAIVVVCRNGEDEIMNKCVPINDEKSAMCTKLERDFLRLLQGGCSTPISALVTADEQGISFKGNITSPDGSKSITVSLNEARDSFPYIAQKAVDKIMSANDFSELLN